MGKITFVPAQSLPLDKLVASSANVRRIKAGVSIAELAEDIGRRGLLQSLNVRAVLDESETGKYAVVAGGRRFAALQLLVKAKRLAKNAAVPCIVKPDGVAAEEDSLAENTMREALHPLDQFRAFQALRNEYGIGDEEIAARFFVTPAVVRQRLKLTTVSPKLLDLYADDAMTLEQLMAFTVTAEHARQEAVWEALSRSYSREPYAIRRMLTEGAVKPTDKRAMFVGLETYEAAGGVVERDLFAEDGGGFLRDAALLDRLVDEKLAREADTVRQEGWLWVDAARDLPYGHVFGLRRLYAEVVPLGEEEQAERDRLQAESEAIEAEYATSEDLPDDADRRLGEIEQRLAQLDALPHGCAFWVGSTNPNMSTIRITQRSRSLRTGCTESGASLMRPSKAIAAPPTTSSSGWQETAFHWSPSRSPTSMMPLRQSTSEEPGTGERYTITRSD